MADIALFPYKSFQILISKSEHESPIRKKKKKKRKRKIKQRKQRKKKEKKSKMEKKEQRGEGMLVRKL